MQHKTKTKDLLIAPKRAVRLSTRAGSKDAVKYALNNGSPLPWPPARRLTAESWSHRGRGQGLEGGHPKQPELRPPTHQQF